MNPSQGQAMQMLNYSVSGQSIQTQAGLTSAPQATYIASTPGISTNATNVMYSYPSAQASGNVTLWNYWQDQYYPQVIIQSYPVYLQDKAMDKGKHAFEIVKALMDKGLLKVDKVKDFIEAMDAILKSL